MDIHITHVKHYLCFLLAKMSASHPQQRGTQDKAAKLTQGTE